MKRSNFIIVMGVVVLLVVGLFLFRALNSPIPTSSAEEGFRAWFWEKRSLDLLVQVILVFAGALGIAALLPGEDQDD
ncbi:MAG: hypothetical protein ACNA70_05565 [Brevefilum sp.]